MMSVLGRLSKNGSLDQALWSKRVSRLLLFVFVLAGVVLTNGYQPSQEINLVPPILAMLDPTLFQADFFVQEMLKFAPRAFTYVSVSVLARTGMTIPVANFLIYLAALASFLAGLKAIASIYSRSLIPAAVLVFWGLTAAAGDIGDVALFRDTWRPSTCAMALSIWGVYFSLRRSWGLAYAFFGAATIPQFLVGVLPAMMVGPLFLADTIKDRRWLKGAFAALIFTAGAGFTLVPTLLLNTTGTDTLTSAEFVRFYAFHRVPQHLVPSSWPPKEWAEFALFYTGGFLCLAKLRPTHKTLWTGIVVVVSVAGLGLVANFLAVEAWPVALVAKLHLARMTPFAQLAVLIGLLVLFVQYLERKNWVACALLVVAPVSHLPGAVLLLVALGDKDLQRLPNTLSPTLQKLLAIILLLCLYQFPLLLGPGAWPEAIIRGVLPISILLTPFFVSRIVGNDVRPYPWSALLIVGQLFLGAMLAVELIRYPTFYGITGYEEGVWIDRLLRGPLMLATLFTPFLILHKLGGRQTTAWNATIAVVVALVVLAGVGHAILSSPITHLKDRVFLTRYRNDQASRLAMRFRAVSPKDALVLIPPFKGQFPLASHRSVVVSYYGFPFSDHGILTWHRRMETILGPPDPMGWNPTEARYASLSSAKVVDHARRYGAGYILSKLSWHPDIDGDMVLREDDWAIWKLSPTDSTKTTSPESVVKAQ